MTMLRMLVVDDDERMRRGLKELLELQPGWQVVGEAANGREAFEKAAQLNPDVVTLDISMPELDGISAALLIRQAAPKTEMLVLSQHDVPEMVSRAFDAGIRAYVVKSHAGRDLVPAVQALCQHASFISAELSAVRKGVQTVKEASREGPDVGASGKESRT